MDLPNPNVFDVRAKQAARVRGLIDAIMHMLAEAQITPDTAMNVAVNMTVMMARTLHVPRDILLSSINETLDMNEPGKLIVPAGMA